VTPFDPVAKLTRLELVRKLPGEYGQPLVVLPWWENAFAALDDPNIHEILLSLIRQSGKSQCCTAMAISEVMLKPNSFTIYLSASDSQAISIITRKVRRPLARFLKSIGADKRLVRMTKRGIEVPDLGSQMEVIAPNEATAPARSPSLLVVDEGRDVPDEVFAALAPSVIGAGGKIVIASSAGRPRGFFYEMVTHPTEHTFLYSSSENENPHASRKVLGFLENRLRVLFPAAARRELANEFVDDGDEFLPQPLIAAAIDDGLGDIPSSAAEAHAFFDLSRRQDLTSRVVVVRVAARRPEALDHLVVASIRVWNPRQSPTGEVDFAEVRADMVALAERFPNLVTILVDEGAEAGAVLPFARAHAALALRIHGFTATPATNMELWGALAARLHAQTLSIPRHERLIGELRSLKQEAFAFGSRWRVVDSSRKFHRDVSLALAGAVFAAGEAPPDAVEEEDIDTILANEVGGNFLDELDDARDYEERRRRFLESW
jgi:hypothetical protein